MFVDHVYKAKAQHIQMGSYTNHVQLNQCMPTIEALAGNKAVVMMSQTLEELKQVGIDIPLKGVYMGRIPKSVFFNFVALVTASERR